MGVIITILIISIGLILLVIRTNQIFWLVGIMPYIVLYFVSNILFPIKEWEENIEIGSPERKKLDQRNARVAITLILFGIILSAVKFFSNSTLGNTFWFMGLGFIGAAGYWYRYRMSRIFQRRMKKLDETHK